MAILNPFANLGIRTPSIKTPQLPAILNPFMTMPTSGAGQWSIPTAPVNYAPLPPTQWGKPQEIKLPTQPVIPNNAAGQPDMSLLPLGWASPPASAMLPIWMQPPTQPAQGLASLVSQVKPTMAPAAKPVVKTPAKTPVITAKAK